MKNRALIATVIVLLSAAAWAVSKDFNGRMWLAQVPALPSDGNSAYAQWVDDGKGTLTSGDAFNNVKNGINDVMRDQAQANLPSQSQTQQQVSAAQQMAQKYGTPEGQAELKNMTPDQLMALARQMQPQNAARAVSPADQAQLQKIGVYSGSAQVLEDVTAVMKEVNELESQWDADAAALDTQEAAEQAKLPVCRSGEAGVPSGVTTRDFELQFADKRIALAGRYLSKFAPIIGKLHADVLPEIDYGDDALAAWTQIQDPGLKQQVSASAHGAESLALSDVSTVEQLIEHLSQRAAKTAADKKVIQRRYADAKGC
ncbi:MAG TPA: hypothetical protein VG267_02375 [Terracidiphilus sp.]|jgi:hypothetical protein|nr:hypothetical protein [Terracidiphilus sp.]